MSIRYKKVQNKIKDSKTFGKWYGRAVNLGSVNTVGLAEELSHATTVTRADIMAVLIELAVTMKRHLQNSEVVKLDGIGSFRVGINTTPTEKKEEFNAKRIKNFHIVYTPERSAVAAGMDKDGKNRTVYVKDLLNGISAEELPNDEPKTTGADGDNTNTEGTEETGE